MRALIVADGDVPERADLDACWPGWDDGIELVVGADGGYLGALALGLTPALYVGDADSMAPEAFERLRTAGVPIELSAAAKDESDTELALAAALRRGATSVTILGGLGGSRFDHSLANVWLLALPAASGVPVELLDGHSRVTLLTGPGRDGRPACLLLPGRPGDLVSLLPFAGTAEGVTTAGLAYPLDDEALPQGPARGLSNLRLGPNASVTLRRGRLLIVETHFAEASDPRALAKGAIE